MKKSAGILLYRKDKKQNIEVLLVHPGGPFFAKKDDGYWTVPKGEIDEGEDALAAAQREFREETSFELKGEFHSLGEIKQKGGKIVQAWAIEGNIDADKIISNTFEIEWPPRSGKKKSFPEIDKAGWFSLEEAVMKINTAQKAFLETLALHHQS